MGPVAMDFALARPGRAPETLDRVAPTPAWIDRAARAPQCLFHGVPTLWRVRTAGPSGDSGNSRLRGCLIQPLRASTGAAPRGARSCARDDRRPLQAHRPAE